MTVAGSANGWTQLAFNTYGTGTDKTIKGGGPSTKALLDPTFRDALGYAIDHQALVDRVLGGYGDVGTTIVPPVLTQWHVDPTDAAHVRHRARQAEARRRRLQARRERQSPRQGRQADHPPAVHAELRGGLLRGGPVHRRVVRRARDQDDRPDEDSAALVETAPAAGSRRAATRPTTTSSCGAGRATPIRTRCCRSSSCDAIGSSSDSLYCNPRLRRAVRPAARRDSAARAQAILDEMQNLSTTRRRTTSCTTTPTSTPTGPTSSPAGRTSRRQRDAAVRLRHARLQTPDRRAAVPSAAPSAAAPAPSASAGTSTAPGAATPAPSAAETPAPLRPRTTRRCSSPSWRSWWSPSRRSSLARRRRRGRRASRRTTTIELMAGSGRPRPRRSC